MRFPKACDTNLNLVQGLVDKTLQAISSLLSGAKTVSPLFLHWYKWCKDQACSGFEAASAEVRCVRQEGH